jgi:hypothetical protein
MTNDGASLLVVVKPDGFSRVCTPDEVGAVHEAWDDLIAWLQGTDPDTLRHSVIVARVAQRAALRMVRYPEYNIRTWADQAKPLIPFHRIAFHDDTGQPLSQVAAELLQSLGFVEGETHCGWLNRVTIELLFGDAPMFHASRELLVPLLLKGPVLVQHWRGSRCELALAVKLILRLSLSTCALTNLIHMEPINDDEHEMIRHSLRADVES